MRLFITIATLFLLTGIMGMSQTAVPVESVKRIHVSGVTICRTTIDNLTSLTYDLKLVSVEEMDSPPTCFAKDARYHNGEGYASAKFPGMIFQEGNEPGLIGKIRLTKEFQGKLPNGAAIEMKTLKLKDVLDIFPALENTWYSRGCSDYWKFSNDTISFFVRIDKSLKPQFPINEAHYYDKPIDGIDIVLSCYRLFQTIGYASFQINHNDPVIFVDSAVVSQGILALYEPSEFAAITVLKDTSSLKLLGREGARGAVLIYSKEYARVRYWKYFASKSKDYLKAVPSPDIDKEVVYILNNKVLSSDPEGTLFLIDDNTLVSLKVIDEKELTNDFGIVGKTWGVVITTEEDE